ncbi:MAG: hypothetical protein ACPG77_05455, partial [Nannocystaceae bacterium]
MLRPQAAQRPHFVPLDFTARGVGASVVEGFADKILDVRRSYVAVHGTIASMSSTRASANITLRTFVFARWVLLGMIACGWAIQLLDPVSFALILSWFPPPPE